MSKVTDYSLDSLPARIIGGMAGVSLTTFSFAACFAELNASLNISYFTHFGQYVYTHHSNNLMVYMVNIFLIMFGIIIAGVSILPNHVVSKKIYKEVGFLETLEGRATCFSSLSVLLFPSSFYGGDVLFVYMVNACYLLVSGMTYFVFRYKMPRGIPSPQPIDIKV